LRNAKGLSSFLPGNAFLGAMAAKAPATEARFREALRYKHAVSMLLALGSDPRRAWTVQDVADYHGIKVGRLGKLARDLESYGLTHVDHVEGPANQLAYRIRLTPLGLRLAASLRAHAKDMPERREPKAPIRRRSRKSP
jgi:DNA-binding MarR family transcriptional regulator